MVGEGQRKTNLSEEKIVPSGKRKPPSSEKWGQNERSAVLTGMDRFKDRRAQGGDENFQRRGPVMRTEGIGAKTSVSGPASAINLSVTIKDFLIIDRFRNPESSPARDGGEIQDDDEIIVRIGPLPEEGKKGFLPMMAIDPLETVTVKVKFVKRFFGGVKAIQVGNATK